MSLRIWLFTDGKVGHEKQSRSFIEMLSRESSVKTDSIDISKVRLLDLILSFLGTNLSFSTPSNKPHIILGTGHGTHLPMLAARKKYKGKIIVIMKPSLPFRFFDLCLIPAHDNPPKRKNIIETNGPINSIEPSRVHDKKLGLILIGGPSKHFGWSDKKVISQVQEILKDSLNREIQWHLTTSRRTPPSFVMHLQNLKLINLTICPFEETNSGWIEEKLLNHGQVWVTQDSFSMIHEAMQSGAAVGLLELPKRLHKTFLKKQKFRSEYFHTVIPFSQWMNSKTLITSYEYPGDQVNVVTLTKKILSI